MFCIRWLPLAAVLISTAEEEEVRRSSLKSGRYKEDEDGYSD